MECEPRWVLVVRINQTVNVFPGTLQECRDRRNNGGAVAGTVRCSLQRSRDPLPDWATELDREIE